MMKIDNNSIILDEPLDVKIHHIKNDIRVLTLNVINNIANIIIIISYMAFKMAFDITNVFYDLSLLGYLILNQVSCIIKDTHFIKQRKKDKYVLSNFFNYT